MDRMTGKQRTALRNLLAAIVLADGRVRDVEIVAYAEKVFQLTGGRFNIRSEADWLLHRTDEIRARMHGPAARHWLSEQVAILKSTSSMTDLLDAIWTVAVSDSDLHSREADILDYAFAQWVSRN